MFFPPNNNATSIDGVRVDNTAIGNGKVLSYNSTTETLQYVTVASSSTATLNQVLTAGNSSTLAMAIGGIGIVGTGRNIQFSDSSQSLFMNTATLDLGSGNINNAFTINFVGGPTIQESANGLTFYTGSSGQIPTAIMDGSGNLTVQNSVEAGNGYVSQGTPILYLNDDTSALNLEAPDNFSVNIGGSGEYANTVNIGGNLNVGSTYFVPDNEFGTPGVLIETNYGSTAIRVNDSDATGYNGYATVSFAGAAVNLNDGSGYGGNYLSLDAGSLQNVGSIHFADGSSMSTASSGGGGGGGGALTCTSLTASDNISFPGTSVSGVNPGFYFNAGGTANYYGGNIGIGLDTSNNIVMSMSSSGVRFTTASSTTPVVISNSGNITATGTITGSNYVSTVATKTSAYTITATDSIILVNSASNIVMTLPTAVGASGREYFIKTINSAATVKTISSQTIDGTNYTTTGYALTALNKYICIVSNGANWYIIGNN
jgi:fibronectin-binding autotransporter adhesin